MGLLRHEGGRCAVLVTAFAAAASLALAGCASSTDVARSMAISTARQTADDVRLKLQASTKGVSVQDQLAAAEILVSGGELVARSDERGVEVVGTLTSRGESGGGLSYENYVVRLCLRYRIAPGTGQTAVNDVECADVPPSALRANETITLDD